MRRLILWGVAAALSFGGTSLWAQEASVVEEAKPLSGYDGGFFVRTADDAFSLKIKTSVKPVHEFVRAPGVADVNTFKASASVFFGVTLFKDFSINTLLTHATGPAGTADAIAPDLYVDGTYQPMPEFGLTVGTFTMPMDRQGETSGSQIGMTARPITATQNDGKGGTSGKVRTIARQSFGMPDTLGIKLFGDVSRFHYGVSAGNGENYTGKNMSKSFSFSGRFAFDILADPGYSEIDLGYSEKPKLQIGVGSALETQDATDAHVNAVTIGRSWTSSGDLAFKWKGFALTTEAYLRKLKIIAPASFTLDDFGYYADAGYFVIPKKLELVARGVQFFREGPDNNAYEFGGGLNWYIHGNNVKLQVDYSRLLDFDETQGEGHRAFDRFRTALTLRI